MEGPIQRRADAETNGDLWKFAGAAEDWGTLSEGDKVRLREFVEESLDAIELGRIGECHWYDIACRRARKAVQKETPPGG